MFTMIHVKLKEVSVALDVKFYMKVGNAGMKSAGGACRRRMRAKKDS